MPQGTTFHNSAEHLIAPYRTISHHRKPHHIKIGPILVIYTLYILFHGFCFSVFLVTVVIANSTSILFEYTSIFVLDLDGPLWPNCLKLNVSSSLSSTTFKSHALGTDPNVSVCLPEVGGFFGYFGFFHHLLINRLFTPVSKRHRTPLLCPKQHIISRSC